MEKSDISKHNISIASIKRHAIKPYDFKWTKFYESNSEFTYSIPSFDIEERELLICSTIIDSNNYSILTTRKLITIEKGIHEFGDVNGALDEGYGEFKSGKRDFTFGTLKLKSGSKLKYFIEVGEASMIMIYGVRTLINL